MDDDALDDIVVIPSKNNKLFLNLNIIWSD